MALRITDHARRLPKLSASLIALSVAPSGLWPDEGFYCVYRRCLMNAVVDIKKGLEGVVVDSTSISLVDGDAGRLYYRGHAIEKLIKSPFAAVAHLVVFGELPDDAQLKEFEDFLWDAGRL